MHLEPRILENRFVRLEPMNDARREEFRAACDADPKTWTDVLKTMIAVRNAHGWD